LHIGDADFAVDAAVHHRLVDADREPRVGPRHADEAEDALRAVIVARRRRAFVLGQQFLGQLVTGKVLADEVLLAGGRGKHRAAAVDHDHLGAGPLRGAGGNLADPIQVERRNRYGRDLAAVLDHWKRCHQPGTPLTRRMT